MYTPQPTVLIPVRNGVVVVVVVVVVTVTVVVVVIVVVVIMVVVIIVVVVIVVIVDGIDVIDVVVNSVEVVNSPFSVVLLNVDPRGVVFSFVVPTKDIKYMISFNPISP